MYVWMPWMPQYMQKIYKNSLCMGMVSVMHVDDDDGWQLAQMCFQKKMYIKSVAFIPKWAHEKKRELIEKSIEADRSL